MSNFDLMLSIARWGGVVLLVLGVIFYFIGKKVDPADK